MAGDTFQPRTKTQGQRQLCYPDILETSENLVFFDVSEPFKDDALQRFMDKTHSAILSSPTDLQFVKNELVIDNPHLAGHPVLDNVAEQAIHDIKFPKEGWRRKHTEYFSSNFGQMGWQWVHGSQGTEPVKYRVNQFLIQAAKDLKPQEPELPNTLRRGVYLAFKRLNPELETSPVIFLNSFQHYIEKFGFEREGHER